MIILIIFLIVGTLGIYFINPDVEFTVILSSLIPIILIWLFGASGHQSLLKLAEPWKLYENGMMIIDQKYSDSIKFKTNFKWEPFSNELLIKFLTENDSWLCLIGRESEFHPYVDIDSESYLEINKDLLLDQLKKIQSKFPNMKIEYE